jgi:hypothetical protein
MDTVTAPAAPVDERAVLRQLAAIQARRYATHPLYLTGLVLMVAMPIALAGGGDVVMGSDPWWYESMTFAAAFFVGILGIIVAYRLTATEDRAIALLPSAPTSATTRTLALIGACLVPALTGLAVLTAFLIMAGVAPEGGNLPHPAPGVLEVSGGWAGILPGLVAGTVVACFGGPALGVAVGRWARFPGAGVLVAIVVAATCFFFAGGSLQIPGVGESWWIRVPASAAPYAGWFLITDAGEILGVRPGSRLGHLFYTISLSGLAVWAAVMRDAVGPTRARWRRIGAVLGASAGASWAWALLG